MARSDDIDRRLGPPDGPNYDDFHAVVVDAIRYGTSSVQPAEKAAREALARLRSGVRPMISPEASSEEHLVDGIASAVKRAAAGALSTDDAAHAALEVLVDSGVEVPVRGPDDPFPEQ